MNYRFYSVIVLLTIAGCASSPSPVLPPVKLEPLVNEVPVNLVWIQNIGNGIGENYLHLDPIFSDNKIIFLDHKGLLNVINKKTGDILWQKEFNVPVSSSLAITDDILIFGTSQGELISINKNNGDIIWKKQLSSEILSQPQIDEDTIIARTVDGRIYNLSLQDGTQNWIYDRSVPVLTLRGTSTPIISNGIVLIGFDTGKLAALLLSSGRVLWETAIAVPGGKTEIERIIDIDITPVIDDDIVYIATYQGRLAAVELASGKILWARDVSIYHNLIVDAYRIYFSDAESRVWALDRNNGATLWKQDKLLRRVITGPVLYSDQLVVGDFDGYLHWLSRNDGRLVSRARIGITPLPFEQDNVDDYFSTHISKINNIISAPIVIDNLMYAMNRHGEMRVFQSGTDR